MVLSVVRRAPPFVDHAIALYGFSHSQGAALVSVGVALDALQVDNNNLTLIPTLANATKTKLPDLITTPHRYALQSCTQGLAGPCADVER